METHLRPPAVPLVTIDPYFSIWSMADRLYDDYPRHWTTARKGMVGLARIDDVCWRFMGRTTENPPWRNAGEPPGMWQKSVEVLPTRTIYTFEQSGVRLTVTFMSPLLLDDLDLASRPFSYIHASVAAMDGKAHRVSLYLDVTGELCVDTNAQSVEWGRTRLGEGLDALRMGTWTQDVLGRRGDDIRIDWGYINLIAPKAKETRIGLAADIRKSFARQGILPESDLPRERRGIRVDGGMPSLAALYDLGAVSVRPAEALVVLGYDDIASIQYFSRPLKAWCFRRGLSFADLAARAVAEYASIAERCARFDERLREEATASGGPRYAELLSLAYRQAIAAHKLVADEEGNALFLSKECFSNGCIATVDVSYPSVPLFLLSNVELAKGMLRPVFRFAESGAWPFDFAPHDVGTYPRANGQVYGLIMDEFILSRQMPVEECGNMLIMTAAVAKVEGKADFAAAHWETLKKWADYLATKGFDPENQLCTDDFAGHLARNANLSIKAIVGLACFGELCGMTGRAAEKDRYMSRAKEFAGRWEEMAREGDHYRLTFADAGTWSLKYNLIWDRIFGFGLFSPDVARREVAWYKRCRNPYGTPMDSRAAFTKTDWLVWAAALAESREDFESLVSPIWDFANETATRTPFTDWYGTTDALQQGFQHRSVIGGIFIKLLVDRGMG